MSRWLNRFQPWGVLLLRLVLGITMAVHGWEKIAPNNTLNRHHLTAGIDHFSLYVVTLGLPFWLGWISVLTEFLGGILLLLGLFTRFAAFMVALNMLVAFATVGIHQGFGIYSYILELAAIAFMLLVAGPGKAALDRKLGFA